MSLPRGTVTFLFTDIEGSTRLWEQHPAAMQTALLLHDQLLRQAIERHHGYVFKTVGDAFCAAFPTAPDALQAALDAHLALLQQPWGETGPIRVRMGLHTGVAQQRDHDYFGPTLNRVARLQGIGHGQQTLLSQATYALVCNALPPDVTLQDLGQHRLKDLLTPEAVWQLLHPSLPRTFPPLKSLDHLPTNLPHQLTSFIGREKEMGEVSELLGRTRLLTLTGSGGTGKTRLAVQAAAAELERYTEGVWLVELAPLSDPALVAQTVADVLGVREAPGEPITRTLLAALKDRQMLLVLDNCEHVLAASASLVDAVLKSCPKVRVLVSSREGLGIAGERTYRVPSLSVPDLEEAQTPESLTEYWSGASVYGSGDRREIRLHADLPEFCIAGDGVSPVGRHSSGDRVGGGPGSVVVVGGDQHSIGPAVPSADGREDRSALPRHQTLRALIDWSYDLLNAEEKDLLHRLSVFAGGWTLEAAESVCGEGVGGRVSGIGDASDRPLASGPGEDAKARDAGVVSTLSRSPLEVLDLLTSLVDKSLVVYEEREGQGRYRLLETVRQYARDRLLESGESDRVRGRHRDYYLGFAEEVEPHLWGADQGQWLAALEAEHENLRGALEWSVSEVGEGSSRALRLCGALNRFWLIHGHLSEGRTWCVRAVEGGGNESRTVERAKALNGAGILAGSLGEYASARAYLEESLALRREIGDRMGIANSLEGFAGLDAKEGASERAARLWGAAEALREEIGSPLPPSDRAAYDRDIAALREAMGVEAFEAAWARGHALTVEQAMNEAVQGDRGAQAG